MIRQYQWRVQRREELEEAQRIRKLEAERAEVERLKRLEQARVDRLLRDAAAFQQASVIRSYVEAIRLTQSSLTTASVEKFEGWRQWAVAQADRIDPSINSRFLVSMQNEEKENRGQSADWFRSDQ